MIKNTIIKADNELYSTVPTKTVPGMVQQQYMVNTNNYKTSSLSHDHSNSDMTIVSYSCHCN